MDAYPERPSGDTRRAVVIAAIGSALAVVPVWLVGGFGVEISAEFSLTESQFGIVTGSFMAASALLSLPGGLIVRKHGWIRGLQWGAITTAVACLGIALTGRPWYWLLGMVALGGASHAIGQPSFNQLLVERVPAADQGLAFGVKQSAIPLGTLVAGMAVPLIGATLGWRWAFVAVGGACLLLGGGVRRWARPPKSSRGGSAAGSRRIPSSKRFPLIVLALGGGFGTAAANSLGAFTVLYAASLGMASRVGGLLLAAGSIANIATRITLGRHADRRDVDHLLWVSAMLLIGSIAFVAMALSSSPRGLLVAVIIAFPTAWGWNGLYHLAAMQRHKTDAAAATGVISLFLSLGGTLGPVVVGFVATRASFTTAWLCVGVMTTLAGALVFWGSRLDRRVVQRATSAARH